MTKRQAEAYRGLCARLERIGFDWDEIQTLRRIEMTLHRWSERECNGEIERAGDDGEGLPYASNAAWGGKHLAYRIPDRERGALRRLHAIMAKHPGVLYYHQGDPRGCALYLIDNRPLGITSDAWDEWAQGHYSSSGIAVCY